jgi:hypothetical protein
MSSPKGVSTPRPALSLNYVFPGKVKTRKQGAARQRVLALILRRAFLLEGHIGDREGSALFERTAFIIAAGVIRSGYTRSALFSIYTSVDSYIKSRYTA